MFRNTRVQNLNLKPFKLQSCFKLSKVNNHHNPLVTPLLDTTDQIRRLKRKYPLD